MALALGADIEAHRSKLETALYLAAQNGYVDIVKTLVDAGEESEL